MAGATAYTLETEPLNPALLYPLNAYIRHSGISKSRISAARAKGIHLQTIKVGRRIFVRGCDGIGFIEALADSDSTAFA